MSVITNLRWLPEPAYIRLDGEGLAADLTGYFERLRLRSDALAEMARLRGAAAGLDHPVAAGVLLELPALDEETVRARLEPLTIQTPPPYQTPNAEKYRLVLVPVPARPGRALALDVDIAAVLGDAATASLGEAAARFATEHSRDVDEVWRYLLVDLTGLLVEGVGALGRPAAAPSPAPRPREEAR